MSKFRNRDKMEKTRREKKQNKGIAEKHRGVNYFFLSPAGKPIKMNGYISVPDKSAKRPIGKIKSVSIKNLLVAAVAAIAEGLKLLFYHGQMWHYIPWQAQTKWRQANRIS